MLPSNEPLTALGRETLSPLSIQLLLFVDDRPSSQEIIRQIQSYLQSLKSDYPIDLQIIEIRQQPHLVEHFRLVATPALVKIAPVPRHTLAGSNLVEQFKKWLVRWQKAIKEEVKNHHAEDAQVQEVEHSGELIRIADEVFRLKQEKEELLEQLKFKDQILAMLAHDLRSPLTAASIAVETLELAYHQPDTERSLQLREQLHQQARKQFRIMNRLITDILQASKSMAAQFTLQQSKFYLQSLCQEILSQFTDTFQEKTLILQSDIPQDLPPVYADEELIRQVIINLLENGIKYTPAGGAITLSVLHRTTQKVQVSISDTGPGIPEEKQEHIFEGHVRLKRDEGKEGYGIGLSVCRKIIRAHYGQIWVDSVPDHGSSFHFTLPVYR
ncbi:MAG: histidine kinase [Microcystis aeruginosa Ma_QC_Ch_20071001_S25]|jgi:two-component system clock-associated histidine kinase SasA|uniref:Adaptive-response sensory-kinase SasA n=1 Tax=Microcystis aeruginosa Ma_QC_Ch_20071001_S25D TaxID=2486250 RepID=A0A552FLV5_MICAE|nr:MULTISPECIES: histidine kinase [unclassified Microcystis]NCR59975.1 histidine kinase [Microcystis aeruginosa LL13-06]TRU47704.1 MAG: histidine kinase [Microcystis aeruginosa Ma_QC_Ch_20071001_S25D]TRU55128.1 MAG: histidine kinase [Microcystis aeruginosa Ma_QC_Ch_20071001_S25]TRU65188.1 MAG: histidine kinase [Microcystis aeruginosa Ma_QC_Ch_20071001_M135]MCA2940151.1 histidine kinase [Microcystis sp. M113S1]